MTLFISLGTLINIEASVQNTMSPSNSNILSHVHQERVKGVGLAQGASTMISEPIDRMLSRNTVVK